MRNLRDELDRRPLWGAFIGSNSALAAEFTAQAGFDWLVIDLAIAHTADPGDALHWGGLGFDMVTATSDTRLISVAAASAVEKLRAGNGQAG